MQRKIIPILLGILVVCFALWWQITPIATIRQFNNRLEYISYDFQLANYLLFHTPKISKDIVIVDVDDKSLKEQGQWPWPRRKVAQLVDEIQKQNPLAIMFDIIPAETQQNSGQEVIDVLGNNSNFSRYCSPHIKNNLTLFEDDPLLAKSIAASTVFLPYVFLPRTLIDNKLPPPLLTLTVEEASELEIYNAKGYISSIPVLLNAAKGAGSINADSDSDGIVRRAGIITQFNRGLYPNLSFATIISVFQDEIELKLAKYGNHKKMEGVKFGQGFIPTDARGYALIPFVGRSHSFPYYSATDILNQKISTEAFTGKFVILGTTAVGLGDLHSTSIFSPFPGVELQASILNGILEKSFFSIPPWMRAADISLTVILGLLVAFSFPYAGPRTLAAVIFLGPFGIVLLNTYIWIQTNYVIYTTGTLFVIVLVAILNILYGYFFEFRRREQLRSMFGQYVHEKHIEEMLHSDSSELILHSEDRIMSVLFADIRNFTYLSEDMTAKELVAVLNTFFNAMTEIILKYNGTIDKYVGDQVMAFWGAPLADNEHPAHAIAAALEMQKIVRTIHEVSTAHGPEVLKIGIGINSGSMSVGDMGSKYRRNYTVLGDSVNLAARAESLTKIYGVDIIVTEFVRKNQPKFIFRKLDTVRVKGKRHSVTLYEVICRKDELTSVIQDEIDNYEKALDLYTKQQWNVALLIFNKLYQQYANKRLYALFIERIHEFEKNPPPSDWNGVVDVKAPDSA